VKERAYLMKIQDKIREDMLLLATVTLNFVTELPEYQQFLEDLKSKDIKFEKGKKEYFISEKTFLSEATVQNVLYGSAKITAQTFHSIMGVKEFREICGNILEKEFKVNNPEKAINYINRKIKMKDKVFERYNYLNIINFKEINEELIVTVKNVDDNHLQNFKFSNFQHFENWFRKYEI